jgi:hypothetical protein
MGLSYFLDTKVPWTLYSTTLDKIYPKEKKKISKPAVQDKPSDGINSRKASKSIVMMQDSL